MLRARDNIGWILSAYIWGKHGLLGFEVIHVVLVIIALQHNLTAIDIPAEEICEISLFFRED